MVQFNKLKLLGFKSFVEGTELDIGGGLTGIVGPNGCGKSNLVEALRWAMGETSAKRMRGSDMDDVIFNGTDNRPARNTAEVTLWLDNSDRTAPSEINDSDELEITRKIEREEGSTYKVNGKVVRAKDVQLLFADCSIGAHSPALVSQGRVADIVNAKPTQRRLILEEAAGISGLHVRRHEAELKLKGAETNLLRVDDVLGTMQAQLEGLKKQARQASRYRNLSTHIQQAEAISFHHKWLEASTAVGAALDSFERAENIVRDLTLLVTEFTTKQTDEASVLPALRKQEAETASALQRLKLAHNTLEAEERQVMEEQLRASEIIEQIKSDTDHETSLKTEAEETMARLGSESAKLAEAEQNHASDLEEAKAVKDSAEAEVEETETELQRITEEAADFEARKNSLERQIEQSTRRLDEVTTKLAELQTAHDTLLNDSSIHASLAGIETEITAAETAVGENTCAQDMAEASLGTAENTVSSALETFRTRESEHSRLSVEAETLKRLLKSPEGQSFAPVVDSLAVESGYEKALAVAVGDELQAALDTGAPVYWRELPEFSTDAALPASSEALSRFVVAPKALHRCLSQIGVVSDLAEAERLANDLKPGQCLVTRDGYALRWDGLTVTPEAGMATTSAVRLEQKNRLAEIDTQLQLTSETLQQAQDTLTAAKEARSFAQDTLHACRDAVREAESTLSQLRSRQNKLNNEAAAVTSRLSGLSASIENAKEEEVRLGGTLATAKDELSLVPDVMALRDKISAIKTGLGEKRGELAEHQARVSQITRETEQRNARKAEIHSETANWQSRVERALLRLIELEERTKQTQDILDRLSERPAQIAIEKQELMNMVATGDKTRQAAADALQTAENQANETARALKEAESRLSDAREARAMAQASVSTSQHTQSGIEAQVSEKFSCAPEALLAKVELNPETDELPDLPTIAAKLERLVRERENMGPVNLRAEVESEELTTQMTTMTTERDDLIAAINRLRQGIGMLNKEARERLLVAFETVNTNFQTLFTRLFNGGRAYLQLVDNEDPLQAGLEIFAQPPGKKLQVLSLLSGGEQTLTAISLIFSMFMTNPAPICVLDEVDAPLDESNVDRVCSLLEDMVKTLNTRFIVITHHRMTMSRMNRLYGVTMSERGVSQLVSVDLTQQDLPFDLADAA